MMKRSLIGVVVLALALIGTGCDSQVTLEAPSALAAVAANDGATLHLSWEAVDGAESYEIKAGDSTYKATTTSIDISVPATTFEVRSVKGTTKSDSAATLDCRIVETSIEFYGDLDTSHFNGFGFGSNGSAMGYTMHYTQSANLDFYAQGTQAAMKLVSAAAFNLEKKGNGAKAAAVGYDEAVLADPAGTYADSTIAIAAGTAYYLRMSADTTGGTWSSADNFAKANVVAIDSAKVTLTLGYQKVDGLRWLTK